LDFAAFAALAVFGALNVAAASSGALFRPGAWYESLEKPWWRPPNWLFGPAWTVLYAMIAVAGWLVWQAGGRGWPVAVYLASLVVNAGWSAIFFGLRRMDWAFAWLILLWLSILATIAVFAPVSTSAAWLLVPYLGWVTFAGVLNWSIWRLNRGTEARTARSRP
jgi:tryptophan-rich sensory protein